MRCAFDLLKCQIRSSGSSSRARSHTAVVVIMGLVTRWAVRRCASCPYYGAKPPGKQGDSTLETKLCNQSSASWSVIGGSLRAPHCSPMAAATPSNVLLRSFQRSGPGGIRWMRCSLPATQFVGRSFGRFFNHRHVALVSPCPNSHGWTICWGGGNG